MTAPVRFTQTDLKRAVAGVKAAGENIARIEIDPNGKIVIIPGQPKTRQGKSVWDALE